MATMTCTAVAAFSRSGLSPPPPPRFPSTSAARPLLPLGKPTREARAAALVASAARSSWFPMGGSRGTGLLERPTLDQSQFDPVPQPEEGGNMGQLWNKIGLQNGDSYRVLLIDDARHTEKLVGKALPQVVPSLTVSDAIKLFNESRENGVAVVIVTVKEHAEFYAQMMIQCGLKSAIEPDSSKA